MLDAQMKRGLIENCVLAALARGDSYGYQIIKDLTDTVQITESTLYPILRRLESDGALTVYSVEHSGRLRKFYHMTPKGKDRLRSFAADWGELAAMYEYIRGGLEYDKG